MMQVPSEKTMLVSSVASRSSDDAIGVAAAPSAILVDGDGGSGCASIVGAFKSAEDRGVDCESVHG